MITKSFLSSGNGLTIRQSQRALRVAYYILLVGYAYVALTYIVYLPLRRAGLVRI